MEKVSKISVRKIGVQPKRGEKPELGKTVHVALLIGIARDYKIGNTEAGELVKFKGNFEATRFADGHEFQSTTLVLPPEYAAALRKQIDTENANGVQFVANLGLVGNESVNGYEWTLEPIGKVSGNADPLAALREEAAKVMPKAKGKK